MSKEGYGGSYRDFQYGVGERRLPLSYKAPVEVKVVEVIETNQSHVRIISEESQEGQQPLPPDDDQPESAS